MRRAAFEHQRLEQVERRLEEDERRRRIGTAFKLLAAGDKEGARRELEAAGIGPTEEPLPEVPGFSPTQLAERIEAARQDPELRELTRVSLARGEGTPEQQRLARQLLA
ncbi:MAG: hypothetical protein ACE5JM_15100, partial [Armatimonadota bacterium]